jgi:Alpha/beta hydrolase domain
MRRLHQRAIGLAMVATVVVVLLPAAASVAAASTPLPEVIGPIPVTADSYPFGAADHTLVPQDLAKVGYVEDEYFVKGKANVYDWPAPGPAVVRTTGAPYTTRILVRRPAKMAHFSGNVVVEMLNPSNLFDLNIGWALTHRQFIRNGDAWVGITAKPISVVALKNFNPQRYASLSFANPLPLDDPRNCQTVAADSSRTTENGLAWDIYSQVGALLRSSDPANPLSYRHQRGSPVRHVYGFGYSQTGGYLYDYINAIHPLALRDNNGRPVYDGYIVAVAGGAFVGAVPINQCAAAPPVGDPRRQFNNVGVPIIHIMSQSDYLIGIGARRPDSDAFADRYRHYEMAGAGHATPDELYFGPAPDDIVKAGRTPPPLSCNEGPRSRFPSNLFFDAVMRNLDSWVSEGIAPPHADPILVQNGAAVLDQFGNVVGGLRSPFVDVPTSTWFGSSTGASFCFIAGHEVPFDQARLRQLYPTHGAYVLAVTRNVAGLVAGRYITAPDGTQLIEEAAHADVP